MGIERFSAFSRGLTTFIETLELERHVLVLDGNFLTENKLEWQRSMIKKDALLVRYRENPFAEDWIAEWFCNLELEVPMHAKVSCLMNILQMRKS